MNTMKLLALGAAAALAAAPLAPARAELLYTCDSLGVTVQLMPGAPTGGARLVRVQAVAPGVMRVTATPDHAFNTDPSLVAVAQPGAAGPVKVKMEDPVTVRISAPGASATVNGNTGQVTFYDAGGKLLLAEKAGGRSFKPITAGGQRGYTVRQLFESPGDDEGIYGLGQHQSDEFNLKGRDEELFQYNTKVSVPMVVSTGGYGLLWDSYSLCRWGNPEPYRQLGQVFTLYDDDGRPGALTGTYTPRGAVEPQIVQREDSIYFEHLVRRGLDRVVNLPRGFKYDGSHVTYSGHIEAPEDGEYRFTLYYSGYVSVKAGGREAVAERWRTSWNPNAYKFTLTLRRGERVPLLIDWHPDGGTAYLGLRVHPPRPGEETRCMSWWGEMQPQIDYYLIAGGDMDSVIHGYRTLTGRAPVMPKWAMGYWQSREKYNTSAQVLGTLAEFRRRELPIDNIVIDWLHWPQDQWGSHEFDPERFPRPKAMVDSIHAMHGRVMVSVWPKFYASTQHFKEFDTQGWMYRLPVADSIRDWVGPGYIGSFYDAYHPGARRLFWQQMQDHYCPLGIDAWWMDASEPNIRDCTDMQYRKDLITPTALGPSTRYFNAYGLMNAQAIWEGQTGAYPSKRVFLLTRSGFAGQQRYSTATWSGDIATRWEDLKAQITAGLNFSASGIPWWTHDIGGFCVEGRYVRAAKQWAKSGKETPDLAEWRELNARWFQLGAFSPLFRSHGQWPAREPYEIAPEGHPAYESMAYYLRLRYRLMPYIYSLAGQVWLRDYTVMRPLAMHWPGDATARNTGDQYMFGPALMAAPVYTPGATTRAVYLPRGVWYDFYTGNALEGGATADVPAPYGRMPLYVRGGSIVPAGPWMQWSQEKEPVEIDLYVYTGADGSFELYEDNGLDTQYLAGAWSVIPFEWDDARSTLTLGPRQGSWEGMPLARTFNIIKVSPGSPGSPESTPTTGVKVKYNGKKKRIKI